MKPPKYPPKKKADGDKIRNVKTEKEEGKEHSEVLQDTVWK